VLLPIALATQLAGHCAREVAPGTSVAVAAAASGLDPLAIRDNTADMVWRPKDQRKALWLAEKLIAAGHRLDLGLMQIDSANLAGLHLTLSQAFDACTSMRAAATVLTADYKLALGGVGEGVAAASGQPALLAAISSYNTGDPVRGFRNGYVARVVTAARYVVPAIAVDAAPASPDRAAPEKSAAPDWRVFDNTGNNSSWNVFQTAGPGRLSESSQPADPSTGERQ
jgi:type IV secretion system protein VirB1